jgi:hypothetical protein
MRVDCPAVVGDPASLRMSPPKANVGRESGAAHRLRSSTRAVGGSCGSPYPPTDASRSAANFLPQIDVQVAVRRRA